MALFTLTDQKREKVSLANLMGTNWDARSVGVSDNGQIVFWHVLILQGLRQLQRF